MTAVRKVCPGDLQRSRAFFEPCARLIVRDRVPGLGQSTGPPQLPCPKFLPNGFQDEKPAACEEDGAEQAQEDNADIQPDNPDDQPNRGKKGRDGNDGLDQSENDKAVRGVAGAGCGRASEAPLLGSVGMNGVSLPKPVEVGTPLPRGLALDVSHWLAPIRSGTTAATEGVRHR